MLKDVFPRVLGTNIEGSKGVTMRQELWKRAVGILTACLMIFTAVPVTALADGEAAGALENIAADCEITVPS